MNGKRHEDPKIYFPCPISMIDREENANNAGNKNS